MLFRDIKKGARIFVLDKKEVELHTGTVEECGFPHMQTNPRTGQSEMVIDISVSAGGKTAQYAIPQHLQVTYAGDTVLSADEQGMIQELRTMEQTADEYFAQEGYHRKVKEKSAQMAASLDPSLKYKADTDKRLSRMEEMMSAIMDKLNKESHV